MKRVFLVQHLIRFGCELESEEPFHSNWINPENDQSTQVPRQQELAMTEAQKICDALGIDRPDDLLQSLH